MKNKGSQSNDKAVGSDRWNLAKSEKKTMVWGSTFIFFFFIVAQYFSLNKYHLINNCNVQNAYS